MPADTHPGALPTRVLIVARQTAGSEQLRRSHGFDEVIISMLQPRISRWLHLDLPRKVAAMGVQVTTVVAPAGSRRLAA